MGDGGSKVQGTYSPIFGFMYIFNLIIGVGALALPRAFSETGLILATILLVVLCGMSFLTSTYVIEAMAAANAFVKKEKKEKRRSNGVQSEVGDVKEKKATAPQLFSINDEDTALGPPTSRPQDSTPPHDSDDDEEMPLLSTAIDDYEITEKYEMGTMANLFYHPVGIALYYICICLYLYGDLAIYVVAIPKSITTSICPKFTTEATNSTALNFSNSTSFFNLSNSSSVSSDDDDICFQHTSVTRDQAYYIFLVVAVLILCPWAFFNLTKSKYLQLVTTIMRNVAFSFMILYAIVQLGLGNHATPLPNSANFNNFPIFFGVSIYSFMVHHSLPGMVTPMRTKKHITALLASDYILIMFFYLVMAYTGAFTFSLDEGLKDGLQDLYTLTFFRSLYKAEIVLKIVAYYLALFPVFILATNFPIISITLRENLKALTRIALRRWRGDRPFPFFVDRIVFPLVAVVPPILIALVTQNEEILVSVTGSFPGIGVQYIIPATLVFTARRAIQKKFGAYENKHKSPFSHYIFIVVILVWSLLSILLTIGADILKIVEGKFTNA